MSLTHYRILHLTETCMYLMIRMFVPGIHGTPFFPGVIKPGKPNQIAIKKVLPGLVSKDAYHQA